MSVVESFAPGEFCWADLATSDVEAAKKFYGELLGWSFQAVPAGDMPYWMCVVDGKEVAAMSAMMPEMKQQGVPPHWNAYVSVANCDETTAKAAALGAKVVMPPFDVMGAGRMSVFQDPSGGAISVWQPGSHKGAGRFNEPGALCWFEFHTRDVPAAKAFFTQLFGWTVKEGPFGPVTYTEFHRGEKGVAGMMPIAPEWGPHVPPNWLAYFVVPDCDAAAGKAGKMGGTVLVPPMDIPHVGRFTLVQDPQGATFGVVGPSPT